MSGNNGVIEALWAHRRKILTFAWLGPTGQLTGLLSLLDFVSASAGVSLPLPTAMQVELVNGTNTISDQAQIGGTDWHDILFRVVASGIRRTPQKWTISMTSSRPTA